MKTQTLKLCLLLFCILIAIVFMSCRNSSAYTMALNSENQNANFVYYENDSLDILKLHLKVISDLGIGWGLTHTCEIISVDEGKLPEIDSNIVIYISVGSKYYSYEDPVLRAGQEYIISFFRVSKNEKSYMPTVATGFMDKQGYIWLINSITEK